MIRVSTLGQETMDPGLKRRPFDSQSFLADG